MPAGDGGQARPIRGTRAARSPSARLSAAKTKATREAFTTKYEHRDRCVRQEAAEEAAERRRRRRTRPRSARPSATTRNSPSPPGENLRGVLRHQQEPQERLRQVRVLQGQSQRRTDMDAKDEREAADFKNAAKALRCGTHDHWRGGVRRKVRDEREPAQRLWEVRDRARPSRQLGGVSLTAPRVAAGGQVGGLPPGALPLLRGDARRRGAQHVEARLPRPEFGLLELRHQARAGPVRTEPGGQACAQTRPRGRSPTRSPRALAPRVPRAGRP